MSLWQTLLLSLGTRTFVPLHILHADFPSLTLADIFVGQHDFEASDWAWNVPFAVRRGGNETERGWHDRTSARAWQIWHHQFNRIIQWQQLIGFRLYRLRYRENAHQIWEYLLEWNAHLPFGVNWNLLQRHQDRLPFLPLPQGTGTITDSWQRCFQDNPVPKNMNTWPSTDELIKHFQEVAEEYGIMPCPRHRKTWDMGHEVHQWHPVTSHQVHEDVYQRPGDGDQIRHQARTGGWHSAKPLELRFLIDPGCCGDLSCWGCTDPVAIVAKRCYTSKIHLHLDEIGWT